MSQSPSADRERLAASMRAIANQLFLHALSEATVEKAFDRHVNCDRGVLRVCEDLYDLQSFSRTVVISIGKAAHTMLDALLNQVGSSIEGIVASPLDPASQVHGFRYFRGGHPIPNSESIRAAEAMLKTVAVQNTASFVIYLISGGGSACAEKPIDAEISLQDLIATYQALVLSGAPIAEINAVRKHLSGIKGGRLAAAAHPAQQVSILVSDVPDSAPDALASGPTMPDSTSVEDCHRIVAAYGLAPHFPASVRELFDRHALEETPKSDDPTFHRSRWWTILSNKAIVESVSEEAKRLSFAVEVDDSCDDWDYEATAEYLVNRVRELRKKYARVCLISGGESTVKVQNGGVGGRNQQLVLAMATKIAGENFTVLSAGTDGIDGNSLAAGAIADGTTIARGQLRGFNPQNSLANFDAYRFFDSIGDAVVIGPTGNNLRDVRILLAY
jgi:hydroxypyruvate reductase